MSRLRLGDQYEIKKTSQTFSFTNVNSSRLSSNETRIPGQLLTKDASTPIGGCGECGYMPKPTCEPDRKCFAVKVCVEKSPNKKCPPQPPSRSRNRQQATQNCQTTQTERIKCKKNRLISESCQTINARGQLTHTHCQTVQKEVKQCEIQTSTFVSCTKQCQTDLDIHCAAVGTSHDRKSCLKPCCQRSHPKRDKSCQSSKEPTPCTQNISHKNCPTKTCEKAHVFPFLGRTPSGHLKIHPKMISFEHKEFGVLVANPCNIRTRVERVTECDKKVPTCPNRKPPPQPFLCPLSPTYFSDKEPKCKSAKTNPFSCNNQRSQKSGRKDDQFSYPPSSPPRCSMNESDYEDGNRTARGKQCGIIPAGMYRNTCNKKDGHTLISENDHGHTSGWNYVNPKYASGSKCSGSSRRENSMSYDSDYPSQPETVRGRDEIKLPGERHPKRNPFDEYPRHDPMHTKQLTDIGNTWNNSYSDGSHNSGLGERSGEGSTNNDERPYVPAFPKDERFMSDSEHYEEHGEKEQSYKREEMHGEKPVESEEKGHDASQYVGKLRYLLKGDIDPDTKVKLGNAEFPVHSVVFEIQSKVPDSGDKAGGQVQTAQFLDFNALAHQYLQDKIQARPRMQERVPDNPPPPPPIYTYQHKVNNLYDNMRNIHDNVRNVHDNVRNVHENVRNVQDLYASYKNAYTFPPITRQDEYTLPPPPIIRQDEYTLPPPPIIRQDASTSYEYDGPKTEDRDRLAQAPRWDSAWGNIGGVPIESDMVIETVVDVESTAGPMHPVDTVMTIVEPDSDAQLDKGYTPGESEMTIAPNTGTEASSAMTLNGKIKEERSNSILPNLDTQQGSILVFGGINPKIPCGPDNTGRDVYMYTMDINKWTKVGVLPHSRTQFGVARVDTNVYLIGGTDPEQKDPKGKNTGVSTTLRLNLRTGAWDSLPELEKPRSHFGCVAMANNVYVIGGNIESKSTSSCLVFNVENHSWKSITSLDTARSNMGITIYNDKIVVAGGTTKVAKKPVIETVSCYDPSDNRWTPFKSLPSPRGFSSLVVVQNTLYAVGGAGVKDLAKRRNSSLPDILKYNQYGSEWEQAGSLYIPRHGHESIVIGDAIITLGGVSSHYMGPLSSVEVYYSSTGEVKKGKTMQHNKSGMGAVKL